jgi:predicted flap endonuclease-1-like 5' DNA nuclease
MPEITVIDIVLVAIALLLGVIVGWIFRGRKSAAEKTAIGLGWQEQLEAQRKEHERLVGQNKSLMEQNAQYQASNKDAKMRASELSGALKEAFERRDELQRQIKDIRNNLEATIEQRNQLQSDIEDRDVEDNATSTALKLRDEQIAKLKKDLEGWQGRVPPLVERFRIRNEEANALELELAAARAHISGLEEMVGSDQTRVEPVDPEALGDNLNASNDSDEPEESDDSLASDDNSVAELLDILEEQATTNAAILNPQDNLMDIKGIGPAIAKTLNEMGIFNFEQIADMNEYDIDRVAQRLKGFRSRIYREDWLGQARLLLDQKLSGSA